MTREDSITFWRAKGLWTGTSLDGEGRTTWTMVRLWDVLSSFEVKGFSRV